MSMTKATTLTKTSIKPRYLSPDASHELIPKMWAANMERLGSLMREIPDEAAAEDIAREWMDEYYEVSDHIEGLWQFTTDLSTKVPDYPKETQEAIGKSKPKPVPGRTSGSQAGGETTRQSQQQLEKAAARGNEGNKDLLMSGGSAPIEAAATGPEESATQGSGGGMEAPTLVFGPPISGILEDKANPVKPQPDMEEINLTTLRRSPLPEEDVPRAWKGKH
ncbi:hypothetical protein PISMIDRAFT_7181 [Pisolithus microcarpus 441]|uniref:Unplaced genomic scaffold scaffold_7, whole genome shotgun sequence n=1 Tax=Pisolithus microcarpus 441 TaxID=765257 RepID=A0A0D0A9N3_9AGAM|nr:hypothetical protein PISMIDRAFT_7181 [Pisolithus microcarpus 441]